ncbi:MAG: hypothetical protein R6V04_10225 [bacterium]
MKILIKSIFILCFIPLLLFSQNISLTIYNNDLALIREIRNLQIKSGTSELAYVDVAARIKPTSVHFKSITSPDKLTILEQNFEYDLVSSSKIMKKYLDQAIQIVTRQGDVFEGTLLSAEDSNIVIKNKSDEIKIITNDIIQYFNLPELPEGLIIRPTLVWLVNNKGEKNHKTEISYLTNGMQWQAEYVGVVDKDDKVMELSGWVSIQNNSGNTYENAKVKLIAGDVHTIEKKKQYRIPRAAKMEALAAEPQFEEKAFFEYHLYTLNRRSTFKNNQTKQLSLFPQTRAQTKKVYIYDGQRHKDKVRVNLEFQNSKTSGLGLPLPKGKVRVYKKDVDGAQEFIGEDQIDHTPADETVRIYLGNAFDIVGEWKKIFSEKIGSRVREDKYQINLRNHKESEVEIVIVEHFWGDWEIIQKSHSFFRKDAYTAESVVTVPEDGEVEVEYTVRLKW